MVYTFDLKTKTNCLLFFLSYELRFTNLQNDNSDATSKQGYIPLSLFSQMFLKGYPFRTYIRRWSTAATQSHSPAVVKSNMVLKSIFFGSIECTEELKLECANFLGQTS